MVEHSKHDGGVPKAKKNRKPWRKILYERQDYPDNYSPEPEFLLGLKTNVTAETYTFRESVIASCVLTQALGLMVAYGCLFAHVFAESLPSSLLAVAVTLAGIFGILFILLSDRLSTRSIHLSHIKQNIKTLAIFLGFGYGMSPVFKTLTETISTDTIYATATFMFGLSALFHDYGVEVFIVSSSLSLNAAIFGAVCLISRLPTSNDAFTMLALAVELFGFFPFVRSKICEISPGFGDVGISVTISILNLCGLYLLEPTYAFLYAAMILFISFLCPLWLVKMQPIKSTIHGPWDEAVIESNDR